MRRAMQVCVWNPVLSEQLCSLKAGIHPLVDVAVCENVIVAADATCGLRAWDLNTLLCTQDFAVPPEALAGISMVGSSHVGSEHGHGWKVKRPSGAGGKSSLSALIACPPAPPATRRRLVALAGGRVHSFITSEREPLEPQARI
jgi:hypothetical protein